MIYLSIKLLIGENNTYFSKKYKKYSVIDRVTVSDDMI